MNTENTENQTTNTVVATPTASSPLLGELQQLAQDYHNDPEKVESARQTGLQERRNQACLEAMKAIMKGHEGEMRDSARVGHQSAAIYRWQHSDQTRFNDCYLRDLLNKGDLIDRLQQAFDELHGQGCFQVYSTVIGRADSYPDMSSRRYGVFVSWNTEDFERLQEMNRATRERFTNPRPYSNDRRGRGRGRGRGARGRDGDRA